MKALSIKQPWAWLICKGYKDIENRSWHIHMPPLLNYPSTPRRVYVHAGKKVDTLGYNGLIYYPEPLGEHRAALIAAFEYGRLATGAIIGEVDITGCTEESDSPWFAGPYGFTLANPMLYEKPIPCRGKLGFFEPEINNAQD